MKKLIVIIMIAACLILYAAVWPQSEAVEEVPATPPPSVVITTQPEALEATKIEEPIMPEEEKVEIPPSGIGHDIIVEPDPTTDPAPVTPGVKAIDDPAPEEMPMAFEVQPTPEPQFTPAPAPSRTTTAPQSGDMVYVPGFGWLECQGPGEIIHDENLYENGNKIGVMG